MAIEHSKKYYYEQASVHYYLGSLLLLLIACIFWPLFVLFLNGAESLMAHIGSVCCVLVLVILFVFSTKMWRCTTITEINETHLNSIIKYFWGKSQMKSILIDDIVCISYDDAHSESCLMLANGEEFSLITEKAIEFLKQEFQILDKRKQILKSP